MTVSGFISTATAVSPVSFMSIAFLSISLKRFPARHFIIILNLYLLFTTGICAGAGPSIITFTSEYPSDIKLAWDKKGIYGLVVSPDPPLADENKSIWNNSNVEIFVSPGTKKEDYFHYAVDPFNKRHSGTKQLVPVDKPYNGYWKSPGFQSAVDTTEKGWTLEFFIPYEDLKVKSPRAYDTWMVNIVINKVSRNLCGILFHFVLQ